MGDPNNNRGSSWQYLLLAIPAVAAAVGVQYLVRNHTTVGTHAEVSSALKPSFYKMDEQTQKQAPQYKDIVKSQTGRLPASKGKAHHEDQDAEDVADNTADDSHPESVSKWSKPLRAEANRHSELADAADGEAGAQRHPASHEKPITDEVATGALAGNLCQPIEYKGDGPANTKISKEEWAQVMVQFHDVKDKLLAWMDHHKKEFMDKTYVAMEQQVRKVEIERPPTMEEPDLNWRGVAVFTYDATNKPMIRVGGGFVKLAMKEPVRSRFELARLVAQSVAPCELQKMGADAAWEPLLKCEDVKEENACGAGTFSDAGWAVSSTLAAIIAPPGCTIPAFAMPETGKCLKKVPLPLNTASISDAARTVAAMTAEAK